jgi:hypothetical protein
MRDASALHPQMSLTHTSAAILHTARLGNLRYHRLVLEMVNPALDPGPKACAFEATNLCPFLGRNVKALLAALPGL